jgi:hypothetical protein
LASTTEESNKNATALGHDFQSIVPQGHKCSYLCEVLQGGSFDNFVTWLGVLGLDLPHAQSLGELPQQCGTPFIMAHRMVP